MELFRQSSQVISDVKITKVCLKLLSFMASVIGPSDGGTSFLRTLTVEENKYTKILHTGYVLQNIDRFIHIFNV